MLPPKIFMLFIVALIGATFLFLSILDTSNQQTFIFEQHSNTTTISDPIHTNKPLNKSYQFVYDNKHTLSNIQHLENNNVTPTININLLHSIHLSNQINKINKIYRKLFNITNSKYLLHENNLSTVGIITSITGFDITSHNGFDRYKIAEMTYSYQNKLYYSHLHNYSFIIDNFNYLNYLNISKYEHIVIDANKTLNKTKLKNGFKYYNFSKHKSERWTCGEFPGHWVTYVPYPLKNGNGNTRDQRQSCNLYENKICDVNVSITNHYNKVLSVLYWTQYFDYILLMDDDAIFTRMNTSIPIWFDEIDQNAFLIPSTSRETFAVLFKVKNNKHKVISFVSEWFEHRKLLLPYYEQNIFWYQMLKTYFNDKEFINGYLNVLPVKMKDRLVGCYEMCLVCPQQGCLKWCLKHYTEQFVNSNKQLGVIYIPLVGLPVNAQLLDVKNIENIIGNGTQFSKNLMWGWDSTFLDSGIRNKTIGIANLFKYTFIVHHRRTHLPWIYKIYDSIIGKNVKEYMKYIKD
eukprot:231097_1